MQRCQEFTVIPAAPAAARARRPERRNHDLPLGLGHLSQHGRLLRADPSESPMPSNVNPLFSIHRIPSTRPKASTGLSRSTIYLRISQGTFPKPIKLGGRAAGWVQAEIQEWLQRQIEVSRGTVV